MRNKETNKNMKTMNSLLLAGAVALGFTLTTTANAGEPFLSPKAAALRHDFRTVPSADTSPILVSGSYLGAASRLELNRVKVVPSGTLTPNLVSGNYRGADAKNPSTKLATFEIGALACNGNQGNSLEAGCTMVCCAK